MSTQTNANTITLSHMQDDCSLVLYMNESDSASWNAVIWPDGSGYEYCPDGSSEPEARDLSDEARALARDIRDHLWAAEQSLGQQVFWDYEASHGVQRWDPTREVEVPPRRKIGSMGFRAWKAAYDAAQAHNRRVSVARAWIDARVAKEWPQWEADVLALYR